MSRSKRIVFPPSFSESDKKVARALIGDADRRSQPYNGNWKAPWLLSDIRAPVWKLLSHSTRKVGHTLCGVLEVNWDFFLVDGSKMSDSSKSSFQHALQDIAFLWRWTARKDPHVDSFIRFIDWLKCTTKWLYINEDILSPNTSHFRRIDDAALKDYFRAFSRGGGAALLELDSAIVRGLYRCALGSTALPDSWLETRTLAKLEIETIRTWLRDNGAYQAVRSNRRDDESLQLGKLCALVGLPHIAKERTGVLSRQPPIVRLIEQIEPDWKVGRMREFHDAASFPHNNGEKLSWSVFETTIKHWTALLNLYRHVPDSLPDPAFFNPRATRRFAESLASMGSHTPWMPLELALNYTCEAVRWVHCYGEAIVDLFLECYGHFLKTNILSNIEGNTTDRTEAINLRDQFVTAHIPEQLCSLGISGWTSQTMRERLTSSYSDIFVRIHDNPGLWDCLHILFGAIATLVGTTKPLRESELRYLPRECISHKPDDGYYLKQEVRKRHVDGEPDLIERPIPTISARAIKLLERLSAGLRKLHPEISKDPWLDSLTWVLPSMTEGAYLECSTDALNTFFDRFSDYVGSPPDENQSRWYIRMHHLRKSFLICFFWCFKFASLDAARWMAGHADAAHLYAYLEAEMPGDELAKLEAQYASVQLWDFEQKGATKERGLKELYDTVLRHFDVDRLSLISGEDLTEWLEHAFQKKKIRIEPISIRSNDGSITRTEVAYRVLYGS